MHKVVRIFLVCFIVLAVIGFAAFISLSSHPIEPEQEQTVDELTLYVSLSGSDDFSGMLPDLNEDYSDGPFRTIGRAQSAVRDIIGQGMTSNIAVYIRGGEHSLEAPLLFDTRDSGHGGYHVAYKNYPGEEAFVSSGYEIRDWELYKDDIYVSHVGSLRFDTIYENGERGLKARYPNEGYNKVKRLVSANPKTMMEFDEGDIPVFQDYRDLEMCIWPGGVNGERSWYFNTVQVRDIQYPGKSIKLEHEVSYEMGPGSRYYLQGKLEMLDAPGEFYLDRQNGDLYYRPRNLPIEEQNIVVPRLGKLIHLEGTGEETPVENIRFDGLTFRYTDLTKNTDNSAILIFSKYTRNISVENCRIYNSGSHGIILNDWAQYNTLHGNLIYNTGFDGVRIIGRRSAKYTSRNNKITNNRICFTGQIIRHSRGINIHNSGDNEILYNRIHNIPKDGIGLTSERAGMIAGSEIDGIPVTRENAKDFAHTRNNRIAYNDISHVVQDSQDAGMIYCWGVGNGNLIDHNYLHDSDVSFSFFNGIYIDDGSDYITISNNLITRLQLKVAGGELANVMLVKGTDNRVVNNIVTNNKKRSSIIGTYEMAGEPNNNISVEKNIFFNGSEYAYSFINWSEKRFKQADYNLLYSSDSRILVKGVPGINSFSDWRDRSNRKYDQHSVIGNPLFMNEAEGDYRLRYNSPAHKLGFEDIDFESMGLLAAFQFADREDILDRVFVKFQGSGNRSFIRMAPGDKTGITVSARTQMGYVCDLSDAEITYSSDSGTVNVTSGGIVHARSKGMAEVTVSVVKNGVKRVVVNHVMVGSIK